MKVKTIIAVPAIVFVGVAVAVLVSVMSQATIASAHENETKTVQTKDSDKKSSSSNVTYKYTAQSGDSYSKLARKAVQTYGLKHKVNLAGSQIVYAETHLTQDAGSPLLNLGQEVSISEKTVKSWVEKAQKLSDSDKAKWNAYVGNVNFNTDNVGQAN